MIRSPATPLAVAKWITLASAVLIFGCVTTSTSYPRQDWDTRLPPGVSSDPRTFRDRVAAMKPTGPLHIRQRDATCGDGCTVNVSIQAIYDTRTIDPGAPPATGVAVAHIRNQDSRNIEAYYGFRPGSQADYYFWVDRKPDADSSRMTVLEVPTRGGTVRAGRQKTLGFCHRHLPGYAGRADADFVEYKGACTVVTSAAIARISEASLSPVGLLERMLERIAARLGDTALASQGGWIDCNSGCCY
jgi:hypothetical protein